jgi:O-antigen ligase
MYLDERHLANGRRSSHNTFMSLLVEQGVPGVLFYFVLLIWTARNVFRLRRPMREASALTAALYAGTAAALGAITVGDMFVDYLKFEARFWFIGLLMVLVKFQESNKSLQAKNDLVIEARSRV